MESSQHPNRPRILAIDPTTKGFGFAVREGAQFLVDWGVVQVWCSNKKEFLARVAAYIDRYRPALIVLEKIPAGKRRKRARERIELIAGHARFRHVDVAIVTRDSVRDTFRPTGATKFEIALTITKVFPELASRLPRKRKPWMSEDERTNLFDAVSFALTALHGRSSLSDEQAA